MAVTKRQAEQALQQIKQQFRVFLPAETPAEVNEGPKLIHNWDWLDSGPTTWAIVWEGGPYDWALLAETGGRTEFGRAIAPAKNWPAGTFAEPVTSWAVGIYEV
jgi:hypothetical protein